MALPVRGGSLWGGPGQGSHSFNADPNNWESDQAIDIGVPRGTPVYAVQTGTIGSSFGYLPGHEGDSEGSAMHGLRLHLSTRDDEFYYAHLDSFASGLKPGSHVRAGDLIGYSGVAANAEHLHFAERSGYPSSGSSAPVMRYAPGGSGGGDDGLPSLDPAQPSPSTPAVPPGQPGNPCPTGDALDAIRECLLEGTCTEADVEAKYPGCNVHGGGYPGSGVVDSVKSVGQALEFVFSYRFLQIVGGGILVLLGIYLLGKQLGVDVPAPKPLG